MNYLILIVTVVVSVMAFGNIELFRKMVFNAYNIKYRKESWRFVSYALVHAGWMHLLINMWVLYSFGNNVEHTYRYLFGAKGRIFYLLLYVGGVLFSTLFDFAKNKENPYYSAVGASGAVSAVVFASILMYPDSGIYLFPIPFPLPAWLFGLLYLVYSAYMAKNSKDNIGHTAHFWGAVFGIVFSVILVPHVLSNFFQQLF